MIPTDTDRHQGPKRHALRRVLLGTGGGVLVSILLLLLLQTGATRSGATNALVPLPWLATGALLGAAYASLYRTVPGTSAENLINGMILGLFAWVVLALNIYPVLSEGRPMWQVTAATDYYPQLIAYMLAGGLTGIVYGLAYGFLSAPLNLVDLQRPEPTIHTRVVIIGGGYAGVAAAQELEKRFEKDPSVGIWLASKSNYFVHTPMLSEVSASAVESQHISPSLRSFFHNVQVVQGGANHIDMVARTVYVETDTGSQPESLAYDHLVLAMGSVPNFHGVAGVEEHALAFKSLQDAVRVRSRIIDMFERADFAKNPVRCRRMLTFVVAGGGFAGVELAGAINDFARGIVFYYPNIRPEEVGVVLVHSGNIILPELRVTLGEYAQKKLAARGVEFRLGARVTGAEAHVVHLGDEMIPTETLIWTAGNRPNPVLASLGLPLTARGQLPVNEYLAVPEMPGLWAAGDCAEILDLTTGRSAPPTAQHAIRQGKMLGRNVAAIIQGKPPKAFKFQTIGHLAALGHQLAVAEILGYRFSGFLAWLLWRAIYLFKLPTLDMRLRVGLDWLLDIFFPPSIAQTIDPGHIGLSEPMPTGNRTIRPESDEILFVEQEKVPEHRALSPE